METTNRWIVCPMFNGNLPAAAPRYHARLEEWRGPNPDAVRPSDVRIIEVPGHFGTQREALANAVAYCRSHGLTIHETPRSL